MKNKFWLMLLMCTFLLAFSGCSGSGKDTCREVLDKFEENCNSLNLTGILNCVDPTVGDPLKAIVMIGNAVSDQDMNDVLLDLINGIGGDLTNSIGDGSASASELFSKMDIEPKKFHLKSKNGYVTCITTFKIQEAEIKKTLNFNMVKKNDTWYISGIELVDEEK